ncbi:MAG: hypothetical protein LBN27_11415 [Prevotellaceae bacterium]|jgi:hypothetical protein|nr:hypothetical protein [Prevotellaceae bacterium]
MKKMTFILILLLPINYLFAQNLSESEKLDSILAEATVLFQYEKAAWISTDLLYEDAPLAEISNGYFTYQANNKTITMILSVDRKRCVAEYFYGNNFSMPDSINKNEREFTERERNLITIFDELLKKINHSNDYGIEVPYKYSYNSNLIPSENGFKFYLIMGTSQSNVIPIGNDYVFYTDKEGNILSWQKFHSRLLPIQTQIKGEKVISVTHSHLEQTPYITATEIATFMLYAPLYDMNSFEVLSTVLNKNFKYHLNTHKITTLTLQK